MNASMPLNMAPGAVFIAGIIQLAFLIWIISFPIIIIRKLNLLIELIKNK
ncbi:MAG: hypothetical protein Q8O13_02285 [Candidatus Omnitrophota bacterium]|nr:hypothetical protein [Candidatus Omnitrophota bacterium]